MKYLLVAFAFLFLISCADDDMPKDYTAENEQEILDYIDANNLDAIATGTGLYYVVDEIGNGDAITSTSDVILVYKGYYTNKNYSKAVDYAELVLQNSKLEARIKSDAHVIIARSAMQTNMETKAREAYKKVEEIASGELKAEALYYSAYFENKDGSYRVSNQIIQKIAANYATHKYWAAKGLIIMATNFYELKDAYQATYILESVIKNFPQFNEVVEEATKELNRIKTEQAKTNESIKN